MTAGQPRRGRPRDPDAEPRIRQCAIELLLDRGFDRMTVDDVAERAGVGKATIYRRWPSKELLAYDALTTLFDIEVPDPDNGSIEADLREVYGSAVAFTATPTGVSLIRLAVAESVRDPQSAELYRGFMQRRIDTTAETLDRARGRGEQVRDDVDPAVVVQWLAGLLIARVVTGAPPPGPDDIDELVTMTMHGIMTRTP